MPKQNKGTTSGRRHRAQTGPGLVTPIAGIDLSRCGGNFTDPVRDLEWLEPRAQELNTTYRRKAAKIYTHGAVADLAPCSRCAKGQGPFHKCVVAWDDKGYVSKGNRANCYWFHKTSSCTRRWTLPCQALAAQGDDLGEFEEACQIHCHGAHIPDANQAAYQHAGDSDAEDSDAEESESSDEDNEDDDHHNDMNESDDDYLEAEEEAEEEEEEDDASEASYDEQPLFNRRKADDDEDYIPSKAKKARKFTAIN